MKLKMHISIIVLVLTFIGVVNQQQDLVVNQELVLHFSNAQVTSQEAQRTIALVKGQLQDLKVDNIQIKEKDNGKLVITYYSHVEASRVKDVLFSQSHLSLKDIPFDSDKPEGTVPENHDLKYKLDVYDIQDTNQLNKTNDGFLLVKTYENDRYFEPNYFFVSSILKLNFKDFNTKVAYNKWNSIQVSINNFPNAFPEVRAGPIKKGIA